MESLPQGKVHQTSVGRNYVYATSIESGRRIYEVYFMLQWEAQRGLDLRLTVESAYPVEVATTRPRRPNAIPVQGAGIQGFHGPAGALRTPIKEKGLPKRSLLRFSTSARRSLSRITRGPDHSGEEALFQPIYRFDKMNIGKQTFRFIISATSLVARAGTFLEPRTPPGGRCGNRAVPPQLPDFASGAQAAKGGCQLAGAFASQARGPLASHEVGQCPHGTFRIVPSPSPSTTC